MSKDLELHRGRVFTLVGDPMRSHDVPLLQDSYHFSEDGAVLVDRKAGVVLAIGAWEELKETKGARILDHRPHWIMPGLVDAHTHLPQYPVAGRGGLFLQDWLKRIIFPAEARFQDVDYARRIARLFFHRLAASGTTTAAVLSSVHEAATHAAFEEAQASGLRVFLGKVMMDCHGPSEILETTSASMEASNRLCEAWDGKNDGLLRYLYTPRFALTCSRELLEACGREARDRRVGTQTHINEVPGESTQALHVHPWAKHYTAIYLETGIIGANHLSILAHEIYPKPDELQVLWNLPVAIAHCPTANAALRSGEFDFMKVYTRGLDRIALGSDVGAGASLSMFDVMRGAQGIGRNELSLLQLYYLATMGGARSLGVKSGSLLAGYEADFIVVDPRVCFPDPEVENLHFEDVLAIMIGRGAEKEGLVRKTYVRGNKVYEWKKETR